jgi:hypothetical protein
MPLKDYVIGGMDRDFRGKLYNALHAMDDAGLLPGITSGFRDDYRQELANGKKAAPDSSYHGGSRRGGYGHGLAVDLVSVKGETRAERCTWSEILWKWIDAHETELGIGRPYLDYRYAVLTLCRLVKSEWQNRPDCPSREGSRGMTLDKNAGGHRFDDAKSAPSAE